MPKLSPNAVPSYRLHKQSGQAIVTLSGRDYLLGPHGTSVSRQEYDRRIAEWLANDRRSTSPSVDLSIVELAAAFLRHAKTYYVLPDGSQSGEFDNFRRAIRPLIELYGRTRAVDFGPLSLKAVRLTMLKPHATKDKSGRVRDYPGLARPVANRQVARIKSMFRWAVENELVPAAVYHAIVTLSGLRKGKADAREPDPVRPVSDERVEATLPHLSPTVCAMVALQRMTGMRAGEVVIMRMVDIDRSEEVWVYTPARHKTSHHEHERQIYLGPRAKAVVAPYLQADKSTKYLFSPERAEADRRAKLSQVRKTSVQPSQAHRAERSRRRQKNRERAPADRYTVRSYRRAIARAAERAFVMPKDLNSDQQRAWRPTLSSLGTNFGLWPLIGKRLAIVSDARLSGRTDQAVITERLLSITGEDAMTIDRKNMPPLTARLATRFLILTNELPRLTDSSGALANRFMILRLRESHLGREDTELTDKLLWELPGILLWAIEGWRALRATGRFRQTASGQEAIDELMDLASPVGAFVREWCQVRPGLRTSVKGLFEGWTCWCKEQGRETPGTIQVFSRDLRAPIPGVDTSQPTLNGERIRCFDGLELASHAKASIEHHRALGNHGNRKWDAA